MADNPLYRHEVTDDGATVTVDPSRHGTPVDERLFGKFAEHLGRNIQGGMCAQVLVNPTFGPWEFPVDDHHPDGGVRYEYDAVSVRKAVGSYCDEWHLPDPDALFDAYVSGTAFGWVPSGDGVRGSPDVSPEGDRAQRVGLAGCAGGLVQRTYLPLHRTKEYELAVRLRASRETTVTVGVYPPKSDPLAATPLASVDIEAGCEWVTREASLVVESDRPDATHPVAVTAEEDVDLVLGRVTLYPDDHVSKADPEVIDYLREADLPLLRWPGGNFVSGYDWCDGVGPVAERPSRVNPAWGLVEPNLFGTAEFVAFCEAVGCEPMICVNAGDGSAAEAAAWVEYCNGPTDTEMGALRASHGHPESFDVPYWEIGNELFARWQVGWTTPAGNADRYRRFRGAMLDADPNIEVYACGCRTSPDDVWNDRLFAEATDELGTITDHVLTGGPVDAGTDPDELLTAFLGYADQLGREYRSLREAMCEAGVSDPHLAITELQLFADFTENYENDHHAALLSSETMPTRTAVAEPLYDATIIHECIRMDEFVQMLTHSALVNHGGGLQKKRERTWPDPAHYGHVVLGALAGGTPLGVDVASPTTGTDHSFGDIEAIDDLPTVDAMAVERDDKLVVTLVGRGVAPDGTDLSLDVSAAGVDGDAEVVTLSADAMYDENTYEDPDRIRPQIDAVPVEDGVAFLSLPAYGFVRVTFLSS